VESAGADSGTLTQKQCQIDKTLSTTSNRQLSNQRGFSKSGTRQSPMPSSFRRIRR
jgi:hypothetical protein